MISLKRVPSAHCDISLLGGSSTTSEISSSLMVSELDDEGKSSRFNISGTPATGVSVELTRRSL